QRLGRRVQQARQAGQGASTKRPRDLYQPVVALARLPSGVGRRVGGGEAMKQGGVGAPAVELLRGRMIARGFQGAAAGFPLPGKTPRALLVGGQLAHASFVRRLSKRVGGRDPKGAERQEERRRVHPLRRRHAGLLNFKLIRLKASTTRAGGC